MIGEALSGSTPPLLFAQPFGFIFTPLLYGSSAILIREIVVRRRLGWGNILILGAGFGIFQEALIEFVLKLPQREGLTLANALFFLYLTLFGRRLRLRKKQLAT